MMWMERAVDRTTWGVLILLGVSGDAFAGPLSEGRVEFFETRIRPVLVRSCYKCHSVKKETHGLRLDSRRAIIQGGDLGPALLPGNPAASLLIRAIRHESDELRMPPDQRLSRAVVADFETWIRAGAVWSEAVVSKEGDADGERRHHWAFRPVEKIELPADAADGSAHPIDRFIMAGLRAQGLAMNPEASPQTLVRRLYFDLVGLPPTPHEIDRFQEDRSETAWMNTVDRLLASPRYGERWGRHWMDVVRYADTAGDNADYPIPEATLYRDYIIDAFNKDMPYDQFVSEQLAGDILARQMWQRNRIDATAESHHRQSYAEQVIATGFLALSRRYGTSPYERWYVVLEDAIETTSRTFLGMTMRCARCHDHKFDPITIEDYYAVYGIFASTQFPYAGSETLGGELDHRQHFVPLLPPEEADPLIEDGAKKIRKLERELEETREVKGSQSRRDELATELKKLRRLGLPPNLPDAYAVVDGQAHDEALQRAGDPNDRGPIIPRGVPSAISSQQAVQIPSDASGRLQLAQWIADSKNPLTARVLVNRIWQYHFGSGLVRTPSNFGLSGEAPSHPQLLDWLAARFVEDGWSIKKLHRLILSSKTYRLSSSSSEEAVAVDPDNRLHWRFDRRRLDAEAIRDAMLAISGELDLSRPVPHPFPEITEWNWSQHEPFKAVYPSRHRSVYVMTQRQFRHPYLALFDGADTNHSTGRRTSSSTPQQMLYMINNSFVRDRARALAGRLLASSDDSVARIRLAHRLVLNRPATSLDVEQGLSFVDDSRNALALDGVAGEIDRELWSSYGWILLTSNEFVYVD